MLLKLLLVGESGVGKSSLMLRFSDKSFTESFISTIGVDFKIKTIKLNGLTIKLQIWDTGGQERFRTVTQTYFRGAHGIVIVYDVTDLKSFQLIQKWMKEINTCSQRSQVQKLLVGNKIDIVKGRVISTAEGHALADTLKIGFLETSAKDSINVDEMFSTIASQIMAPLKNPSLNLPKNS